MPPIVEDAEQAKKTGGMIALLPADPAPLVAAEGSEPAADLHLTLRYLGPDVTDWPAEHGGALIDAVRDAAADLDGPITARVMGHATFNPDSGPGGDRHQCAVYLVGDTDRIGPLHDTIDHAADTIVGDRIPAAHQPFLPHITAGYGLTAADLTYCGPVVFDRIVVVLAGDRTEIPLLDRPEQLAREAFSAGWARSGGPLTDQVRDAYTLAVQYVRDHPDLTAQQLAAFCEDAGATEGVWALTGERRQQVYDRHLPAILDAWRALLAAADLPAAVRYYRDAHHLDETAPSGGRWARAREAAQRALTALASSPLWDPLVQAVTTATAHASAEGVAAAIAGAANRSGYGPVDYDAAVTDARDTQTLGAAVGFEQRAQATARQIVDGAHTDLTRALVAAHDDTPDGMLQAADDAIGATGDGHRSSAWLYGDMALGRAFVAAATNWLAAAGARHVDVVTTANACPRCLALADRNPWPVETAPQIPDHPNCMCHLEASSRIDGLKARIARWLH